MNYPVLAPPLPEGRYIIDTDASDFAMGAVLQKEQNGTVRVISYASKTLTQLNDNTVQPGKNSLQ